MFREDQYTELKLKLTKEIKKEVVAFANSNDGNIYIGVDDDGTVVGLKDPEKDLEAISGMIREGIKSDLTLNTRIYIEQIEGKDVVVVSVKEGSNKPYYLSDKGLKPSGVYLRHGNASVPASEEVIKKLLVENSSNSFESGVSKIQDLNFDYLIRVFKSHDIDIENKFKTLNITNLSGKYTNLGLLLSDECPYSIKCAIFNGNDKVEFQDRKEFTGSILKQINDTFEYISLYNKVKGKISGLKRVDTYDYPKYAVREALLNAVIHRDYNFNGSILISLFDNRIEIVSLGGLVKGISIKDIFNGVSETRNPNLANIFYRLKYVESFGTGIERIMETYQEYYDKRPIFQNTENTFKVILYNINYESEDVINNFVINEEPVELDANLLLEKYLKKNKVINRASLQEILNISKTSAVNLLNKMIKDGKIMQVGEGKNTFYILK